MKACVRKPSSLLRTSSPLHGLDLYPSKLLQLLLCIARLQSRYMAGSRNWWVAFNVHAMLTV